MSESESPSLRGPGLWIRRFAAGGAGGSDPAERLRQAFDDVVRKGGKGGGGKRVSAGGVRGFRAIVLVILGIVVIKSALVVIPNGHCGVVFSDISGVQERFLKPGLNLIAPFINKVTVYATQTTPYEMTRHQGRGAAQGDDRLKALTSDGQLIDLDVTVTYHVEPSDAPKLHEAIGPTYERRVIRPQSRSAVRMICAQHPVADFTSSKRDEVKSQILAALQDLFSRSFITLEDVSIREVEFSTDFRAAVEQKQQMLQEVEAMEYRIRETKTEAERKIVEAEKDAAWILERGRELERNPLVTQYEYAGKVAPNISGLLLTQEDLRRIAEDTKGTSPSSGDGRDVQRELQQLVDDALAQPPPTTPGEATESGEAQ